MTVIAGDDNWIAVRIDTADDTDVTAGRAAGSPAAATHDCDRSDLRPGNPRAIACERTGQIRTAAAMPSPLQNEIHEAAAPDASPSGRIGADPMPCFHDEVGAALRGSNGVLAQATRLAPIR